MKHLLSILIFLSFISVASADETYLGCWKSGSDELLYEIDINLDQNKLWIDDYVYEIVLVSDKYIVTDGQNGKGRIIINRYTGELTESLIKSDGTASEVLNRVNCKQLKQLF